MIPVVLCGGAGTRLWPLSRESYPKQFLALDGQESLLQATVRRMAGLTAEPSLVVCNEAHRFLVAQQLHEAGYPAGEILLEPAARNTAPALAVASLRAVSRDPEALLLVLPADHAVRDVAALHDAVRSAIPAARDGWLVTFGIEPDHPATGYGYIQSGAPLDELPAVHRVARFVEKPDLATATSYLAAGGYAWNSGMFLLLARRYLEELDLHVPAIARACRAACEGAHPDLDFVRLDAAAFAACPSDSVDYAVMERTQRAAVVPMAAGWSDVGSWDALAAVRTPDADGNVSAGDVLLHDTRSSIAYSEGRFLALLGMRDVVVVETADAVLVAPRDRAQDVRAVVDYLRAQRRPESLVHRRVYRPWGSYEGLVTADRFQVKRIVVRPGARLSLQLHHHRAEHWTVVCGTARVTRGDETFILREDESTYIPLGTAHRLENPGIIPLEIIEVQTGSYLGEDDIVRLQDGYGRAAPDPAVHPAAPPA